MFHYILKFKETVKVDDKNEDTFDLIIHKQGEAKPKIVKSVVYNYYTPNAMQTGQMIIYPFKKPAEGPRKPLYLLPTACTTVEM